MSREGVPVRRGVVLLECLVALSLLGIAAVSISPMTAGLMQTPRRGSMADDALVEGDQLLSAISLWTREELDLRLGERRQGSFTVRIHRVGEELYTVSVATATSNVVLLSTKLLRLSPVWQQ